MKKDIFGLCVNWATVFIGNALGLWIVWSYYMPDSCHSEAATQCPTSSMLSIALLTLISTSLVAAPLIRFLHGGWHTRYEEFRNKLTNYSLEKYLIQYWEKKALDERAITKVEGKYQVDHEKANAVFDQIYSQHYGKNAFRMPNLLLISVVFIDAAIVGLAAADIVKLPSMFDLQTSIAAISGAFMFVVSDLVLLVRRRSLNVTDVYWYVLRMMLAEPIAMTVGSGGGLTYAMAFSICFLPVDVLVKQIRRVSTKSFGITEKEQDSDVILNLQGVTVATASILQAEGVNSIDELIGMDPVLLSIRTGMPFKFVLNLLSQAIVRRHLGASAENLSVLDLDSCEQISSFVERLDKELEAINNGQANVPTEFSSVLGQAVTNINKNQGTDKPNVTKESLALAFRGIRSDNFSRFLTS